MFPGIPARSAPILRRSMALPNHTCTRRMRRGRAAVFTLCQESRAPSPRTLLVHRNGRNGRASRARVDPICACALCSRSPSRSDAARRDPVDRAQRPKLSPAGRPCPTDETTEQAARRGALARREQHHTDTRACRVAGGTGAADTVEAAADGAKHGPDDGASDDPPARVSRSGGQDRVREPRRISTPSTWMVAASGQKPDQRTGRNRHRNDAMAACLIVPMDDRRGNGGHRCPESCPDQGRDGAVGGARAARLRAGTAR